MQQRLAGASLLHSCSRPGPEAGSRGRARGAGKAGAGRGRGVARATGRKTWRSAQQPSLLSAHTHTSAGFKVSLRVVRAPSPPPQMRSHGDLRKGCGWQTQPRAPHFREPEPHPPRRPSPGQERVWLPSLTPGPQGPVDPELKLCLRQWKLSEQEENGHRSQDKGDSVIFTYFTKE